MVFCNKELNCSLNDADTRHNPYFNRWFSAIANYIEYDGLLDESQSLF